MDGCPNAAYDYAASHRRQVYLILRSICRPHCYRVLAPRQRRSQGRPGRTTMQAISTASTATNRDTVPGYTNPETLPRPGGRLTKEDLDPLVKDAGDGNPAAIQSLLRMIGPVVVRY